MQIPVKLLERYETENPVPIQEIEPRLKEIASQKAMSIDGPERFRRRRRMISAVAVENVEDAFERYNGDNDLLPINYLELGLVKSRAVGRLTYFDNAEMKPAVATGFLISPDLVITNNHVFSSPHSFKDAKIEFDYRYDISGNEQQKVIFELDASKFFHCNENWTCVLSG